MAMALFAAANPHKTATIMAGSGERLTYGELKKRSIRLANLFYDAGLRTGDVAAVFLENNVRYHEVYWAAVRAGLYICAVNRYLTAEEVAYIVNDSGAKVLVTSAALRPVAAAIVEDIHQCSLRLALDGPVDGYQVYEEALAAASKTPLAKEPLGDFMNYSSGTTGRPKGIKRPCLAPHFLDPV